MGRKHGFSGTPVRPSNRLSSVAGVFEKRGDPMVTAREGREKFGRNVQTENPDFDRYFAEKAVEDATFAMLATDLLKPKQIDKGNAFRKSLVDHSGDVQRKATNIVMQMNKKLRALDKRAEIEAEIEAMNKEQGSDES